MTAAGTKSLSLTDLMMFAPTANPNAVIKPKISPKKFPSLKESKKNINHS